MLVSVLQSPSRIAGLGHATEYAWPKLLATFRTLVPAYPGPFVVPLLCVPRPPKLTPAMGAGERLRRCAVAYTGACTRAVGTKLHLGDNRTADTVRIRDDGRRFAALATRLLADEIPPAAWCAFSVDMWRMYYAEHYKPRSVLSKRPSAIWVCSAEHYADHLEWYWIEAARYNGGHAVLVDEHRELLVQWSRMRDELLRYVSSRSVLVRDDVYGIVRRHFARGAYEYMVKRAQQAVAKQQAEIDVRSASGEFVL